jgi:flavin-dependent dehydrogenase
MTSKSHCNSNTTRHDVVIVGGGPAGASLAIRLGRAGFDVALLDRCRFPRRKPCGEFMSPACLPILEDLGLGKAVLTHGARKVHGMELFGFDRMAVGEYRTYDDGALALDHGYGLRREVFDDLLFRAAAATPGVTVREGWRVVGLVRDGDGAVLGVRVQDPHGATREVRGDFTIGADGVRSRVARELGVQREVPWLRKFALVTRYKGTQLKRRAEVHLFPHGYFAACPVDDGQLSLNLVVDFDTLPRGRNALEEFFRQKLELAPRLEATLADADQVEPLRGIGPLARTTTEQIFDGAALVGDARGYVDPITGEGIYFALRGAEILAETLVSALHRKGRGRADLVAYNVSTCGELAPRIRLGRLLQRGLRHPWIVRNVLAILAARPRAMDALVSVTGDYVPPTRLLRPQLWLRAS